MAFYESSDDSSNFVLLSGVPGKNGFSVFAKGYHRAASLLAQHLLEKDRFSDYQAYPIVFLYRHSLELHLKGIIFKAGRTSGFKGIETEVPYYKNHRLAPFVEGIRKILEKLFPNQGELLEVIAKIDQISREFEEIDPESYTYRYPLGPKDRPPVRPHQVVNLQALYETMETTLKQLEIIDFGMDIEQYQAQEIWEVLEEVRHILESGSVE
jgi:hypothetical protein